MKIVNGKWKIKNLYDKLEAQNIDRFFNSQRELEPIRKLRTKRDLKRFNYEFKFKN
jgi:hypothetical protein